MQKIKIGYYARGLGHPAEIYAVMPYERELDELIETYKEAGFKVIKEPDTKTPPSDVYYLLLESDSDLVKFRLQFKMPDLIHPFDDPDF